MSTKKLILKRTPYQEKKYCFSNLKFHFAIFTLLPTCLLFSETNICEIIQLSAICGEKTFNAYILPSDDLDEEITKITRLSVHEGSLYLGGTRVDTVPLHEALTSFLTYLRSFPVPVLLAAHNARVFCALVLTRVLRQASLLSEFQEVVSGYLDTLRLCKNIYNLQRNTLPFLVEHFLRKTHDANNAEEDARVLQELFHHWDCGEVAYSEFVFDSLMF